MGTVAVSVRRWRTAAVAGLLCSALLAGCSDDDPEPIVADPPASPSASSSSASASAAPEPWQVRSKAGAVAFVEHWVEVLSDALQTGDTSGLTAVAGIACRSCASIANGIDQIYADGKIIETAGWRTVQLQPFESQKKPPFDVAARIRRAPERVVGRSGGVETFEGSTETYSIQVAWQGGGWIISRFDLVQS